jgi:CheY-like chemotaxis protein
LQQILWNVLKNAVKFTPVNGVISIKTRTLSEDNKVSLQVSDSGIGMTAMEIKHIFDAFTQGEHAKSGGSHRFGGLGLGLAISRMLVKLHSGSIYAASAGRDRGSTFTIVLPLAKEKLRHNSKRKWGPTLNSARSQNKPGLRVLLVEDHEPTRIALANLLSRRKYVVITAASVGEAQIMADRTKLDVIISDIGLPDGNGYDLMSKLRDDFGLRGIALTGYGMEQDVARGLSAGFIAHLIKPIRIETLEKILSKLATGFQN